MSLTLGDGRALRGGRLLGQGGQGGVYEVIHPAGMVFKRYSTSVLESRPSSERRIRTMIDHRPPEWQDSNGHVVLAWPTDVVRENGHFVGFVMPRIDTLRTVELHLLSNPSDRAAPARGAEWVRGFSWRYLVQTAANLALATRSLHDAGYVVGDFNERNVLVHPDSRVTLVDCDSMQVRDPKTHEWFLCEVGRDEFEAPEVRQAGRRRPREATADLFPLAVHIFQLLFEGRSPFDGVWTDPKEDKPSRAHLADRGMYTFAGLSKLRPQPSAPPPGLVPPEMQKMFTRAFVGGARIPGNRPSAQAWYTALTDLGERLRTCSRDSRHLYRDDLKACPWCARGSGTTTRLAPRPTPAAPPRRAAPLTGPAATTPPPPPPPAPPARRTAARGFRTGGIGRRHTVRQPRPAVGFRQSAARPPRDIGGTVIGTVVALLLIASVVLFVLQTVVAHTGHASGPRSAPTVSASAAASTRAAVSTSRHVR